MLNDREWLEDYPELMKKLPPEEKRVAFVSVLCVKDTPFRLLLLTASLIPAFLFWGGRGGPILDWGIKWKIGTLVWFIFVLSLVFFLGRHEKGRVDIYPNMFVLCDYDMDRKEARPCQFYYWSDIVQYHAGEGYIWLGTIDSDPVRIWGDMAKLRPYFEEYAPHAEVVRFNMKRYFEEREKRQSGQDEEK